MKKFTSLLLATIMLLTLAISASAGNIISDKDPVSMSDLLGMYKDYFYDDDYCDLKHIHDYTCYPGYGNTFIPGFTEDGDKIYTAWYGTCPECEGFAYFYVYRGDIKWNCLEPKCGKSGTIYAETDKDEDEKPDTTPVGVTCPNCKSAKNLTLLDTYYDYTTKKFVDQYFCSNCVKFFTYSAYTRPTLPDCDDDDYVICTNSKCSEKAYFDEYFYAGGYLYANYECKNGHVTAKRIYNYDYDKYLYNIRVIATRGGSYNVAGGEKAAWGEKKTFTFTADKGYVLTDVYVNGERLDKISSEMTIEIKGNTVVRAYFTRIAELKNYTVTATANGGGEIGATLNGKAVDADKIVANYADTITYSFVPTSKNYIVDSVKVNGKNVGAVKSYTVDRLKGDATIEVTFKWDNPYDDVADDSKYIDAIEYTTESGILTGSKATTLKPAYNFNGTLSISVKTFACALAEMSDVNGILTNNTDRSQWAIDNGLIGKNEEISVVCDVQRACKMVKSYLIALEEKNDVKFVDFDEEDTAKEMAIEIGMVSENGYETNKNINKYDLAAVLYLISGLKYIG